MKQTLSSAVYSIYLFLNRNFTYYFVCAKADELELEGKPAQN